MYKITFNFPNLPKGGEVDITGLNHIFENGSTYTISEEEAQAFRDHNPVVLESDGDGVYGPGPTLLEAFKDNKHVKVETIKPPKDGDK